MVPRPFGLAFLSCFEELDRELCEPQIRAYMEQQVGTMQEKSCSLQCLFLLFQPIEIDEMMRLYI
jgi:hypothetical protein